mgnify:CR=1 FL=1
MTECTTTQYESPLWPAIVALRLEVYVDEQKVPLELELDDDDRAAVHFAALDAGEVVGTARLVFHDDAAKFGRLAVKAALRGKGIARQLIAITIDHARDRGVGTMYLDSQTMATGLYAKFGFVEEGGIFLDAGIEHLRMVLRL